MPRKKRTAPRTIWIAEVLVSERIAEKIISKHGLDPDEIATLTKSPPPKIGRWVADQWGTRLFVKIRTSWDLRVLVVLYPLGDDIWRLASAYVLEPSGGHDGAREG